ncbi:Glycerophosphoryl diester phosphodiesterase (EC [Lentimonas sp. CC19]|nr:Glycerophosphoryl diester phosphodiesterase (EC [Lentimonas sp. CC19]CAA6695864.1 Glycerophosphoryl diester phosphodiesterase (EC [Lentimonas sp. CC10]CAA7069783.1 Glycerophosphoryl diester phosphodiesterase (EC [Lentimonas sp. CC11]
MMNLMQQLLLLIGLLYFWSLGHATAVDIEASDTSVTIIAHRGSGLTPTSGTKLIGNTFNAIQQGVDHGANWIEIDIRQSKDGTLMVFHDETVDRVTNGTGAFDSFTKAQLQAFELNVAPIEHIPTLKSVLRKFEARNVRFVIDIKVHGIRQQLEPLLAQHIDKQNVMLFGKYSILKEYIDSPYPLGYTALYSEGSNRYRFWLGHDFLLKRCITLGADTLVLPPIFLKQSLIKSAKEEGLTVWSYGNNAPSAWNHAISNGVTGLIVDDVALTVEQLSSESGANKEPQPNAVIL